MLLKLYVKNLALIEELDMDFSNGLNIITGETGAGKSLLLGSINIALGDKFQKDLLRSDCDSAIVELTFDKNEFVSIFLSENDIDDLGEEVVITRKITKNKSISKINGETVSVKDLKEVMSHLIDIHGQHEHQSLIYKEKHLEILDKYAGKDSENLLQQISEKYKEYVCLKENLENFDIDENEKIREMDLLEYEIKEINEAGLTSNEDAELEELFKKLSHGKEVASLLDGAYSLSEGEFGNGLSSVISDILYNINRAYELNSDYKGLYDSIIEIDSLTSDFIKDLSFARENVDNDEEKLREVSERLDIINHLKMKYGKTIEDINKYLENNTNRLNVLLNYEEELNNKRNALSSIEEEILSLCEKLSTIRRKYAQKLKDAITDELLDLNFLDVRFDIQVSRLADFKSNGFDEVSFYISTNPGEDLKPLGKVASGGELSRIMLAIKTVLSDMDETNTLIFDEIDAGISGITAGKVAKKLADISRNKQVLCITHLAQIASMADEHFLIEKSEDNGKTKTTVVKLDADKQIDELMRIISGDLVSDEAKASANKLKSSAIEYKNK